jgi:hypothetical protein
MPDTAPPPPESSNIKIPRSVGIVFEELLLAKVIAE